VFRRNRAASGLPALLFALASLVGGCATTQVDAVWSRPEYAGRSIPGKMLVVGVTRDETVRRLYEDTMAAQLRARGVAAVPSYEFLTVPLSDREGRALIEAAKRIGAARILSSALVAREHVQWVETEPVPAVGWDYYGWYGYYWPYGYMRTETHEYDRYYASTTLTDVSNDKVYWSARTRSEVPGRIETAVNDFVSAIVDALSQGRLL